MSVPPMYMAGRLRTGSRPSRTLMSLRGVAGGCHGCPHRSNGLGSALDVGQRRDDDLAPATTARLAALEQLPAPCRRAARPVRGSAATSNLRLPLSVVELERVAPGPAAPPAPMTRSPSPVLMTVTPLPGSGELVDLVGLADQRVAVVGGQRHRRRRRSPAPPDDLVAASTAGRTCARRGSTACAVRLAATNRERRSPRALTASIGRVGTMTRGSSESAPR